MNRGTGGNRGRGGDRRGGAAGGRYYTNQRRSQRPTDHDTVRRGTASPSGHWVNASLRSESSRGGWRNSELASVDDISKKFDGLLSSDYPREPNCEPSGVQNLSPNDGNSKLVDNAPKEEPKPLNVPSIGSCHSYDSPILSTAKIIQACNEDADSCSPSHLSCTPVNVMQMRKDPSQSTGGQFSQEIQCGKAESVGTSLECSDSPQGFSFDICEQRDGNIPKLKTSLLHKNRAIRNETKRQKQGDNIKICRPGMILLKGYIPLTDQVKLIKSCRDLGRGPGGFYQPGYRDGAELHLKMMCLGKNWDPETSRYSDKRPIDQAKPPPIPNDFQQLVREAIGKCHHFLESDSSVRNARDILPSMSPDICIINFYTNTGKLGLHQDKDESKESIDKRLPVVSISLGDTAEFQFGDDRDIDKAKTVDLESGDVLIFGGPSRSVFHGVSSIKSGTAPKPLLEESGLRPGRLNLTFRQY